MSRKKRRHNHVTVYHDGLRYGIDALTVMADNLPFLGGRFRMSPGADPSDGSADLCLIENSKGRLEVLNLLWRVMRGTHAGLPYVSLRRVGQLAIDCDNQQAFFGDGEILQEAMHFDLRVLPRALKLIVPAKDGD
jgi:diacylglycerol kinase (ATP)